MQFKKQGRRVQVLAYRGYDKEKRRSIIKMLGSYDAQTYKPSDGLIESMTDEERKELQSHMEEEAQRKEKEVVQALSSYLPVQIKKTINAIENDDFEPSQEWSSSVFEIVDELRKSLRKRGHTKPRKAPQQKSKANEKDQAGLRLFEGF